MGKKSGAGENGVLHKLLKNKIDQLENGQRKNDEETRADEAHKAATYEARALVESSAPVDSKLRGLQAKVIQKANERRALEYELGRERRRGLHLEREQENMKAELGKMTAAKTKLEALSRELSKQNKLLVEESEQRMAEEKSNREEIVQQFNAAMMEINAKLEIQCESRNRQEAEIELLKQKLRDLLAKYEVREEHFEVQMRTRALEVELAEARTRDQASQLEKAEIKYKEFSGVIDAQSKTEANLRAQLAEYGEKFDKFQETLDQSNQVFSAYTAEMEKMSKTVKQLQKTNASLREENAALNKKCTASTYQLVTTKSELEAAGKAEKAEREKKEKLEKLCRGLASERASLQKETDALQRAWHALKTDIDALRDQSEEERKSDRLWEVLRSLVLDEG